MNQLRKTIIAILISCFCLTIVHGQTTIPSAGGNASGSGGSVSFSVGQITIQTISGTTGTVAQGVQQPYEISIVTAIENTEGITLEYKVYPNPARELINLIIRPMDQEKFKYQLFDLNGMLLQDRKVESEETEISLGDLSPSVYFLKISKNSLEVKIFKIIKK